MIEKFTSNELKEQIEKYLGNIEYHPTRIHTANIDNNDVVFIWRSENGEREIQFGIGQYLDDTWSTEFVGVTPGEFGIWQKDFDSNNFEEAFEWLYENDE